MNKSKICLNCSKTFIPSKNDIRIKFCCEKCRVEYRKKNNYMKKYYRDNQEKYKEMNASAEHKQKKNLSRNMRYHSDEKFRQDVIKRAKQYRIEHPNAKRKQDLMEKYGITLEEYNSLLEKQDGGCAICGNKESGNKKRKVLYVDHDHNTGKVRGLLCHYCNFGLGNFRDNTDYLKRAIAYLEECK